MTRIHLYNHAEDAWEANLANWLEIWLIDWKTNQKWRGETDAAFAADLREKYLPQLESYRHVIEHGFQKPVARLHVYFTVLINVLALGIFQLLQSLTNPLCLPFYPYELASESRRDRSRRSDWLFAPISHRFRLDVRSGSTS